MLPQKVTDQMAEGRAKTSGVSGQLLMFSLFLLILSIVFYAGLQFGYKTYLNKSLDDLESRLSLVKSSLKPEDQSKIISFYSQIENLKDILGSHTASSPIFSWLESNTQTNVYFKNFSFDLIKSQIVLSGTAKNMDDLSEQILVFEKKVNDGDLRKLDIGSISVGENDSVNFSFTITASPDLLKTISGSPTES
jgi:hypothetical protein